MKTFQRKLILLLMGFLVFFLFFVPFLSAEQEGEFFLHREKAPSTKAAAVALLPRDKYNMVDWAEAIRMGILAPLASIDEKGKKEKLLDLDVIIQSKRRFMPNVLFPHDTHTYWLSCEICHPKIFIPKKGGNLKMTMWKIARGQYCGRCHDRVAFPIRECYRCHMDRIPENFPKIKK